MAGSKDTAAATTAPVKPWHFHTHFLRLFSARPASRPGAETWNSLDGWRGLLCVWMVAFHSFFYAGNFVDGQRHRRDYDTMYSIGLSPALLILNLGFLPVDGFFVLTGFLIAYPLFKEEAKRVKVLEAEKSGPSTAVVKSSPWTFDLSTFYYRRVTRMLPSYILAVYFHCGLLFPNGLHSIDLIRSKSFRGFLERVLPGSVSAPSSCTPGMLFTNFTWMNHLMPFGGCMGWTWSFALQFNFYLFFPLLWWWAHRLLSKKPQSSQNTPSSIVLPFLYAFLAIGVFLRILSFFQLRTFDLKHEEGVFLGFFWYSNTFTRGGAIVWGVLAAYASTRTNTIAWMKTHLTLVNLGWLLLLVVVLLQMFWSRIFSKGNMLETPGWNALEQTQLLGGEESKADLWAPKNLAAYWHHFLFHTFVLVGSPLSNLIFVFLLLVIVNGIGSLGRSIQSFLSFQIWFPLSTLSWWVYLVHPAIMTKFYAWHTEHVGDLPASVSGVFLNAGVQYVLSFSTALVAYVFIEQPLEILLRQGEAASAAVVDSKKNDDASSTTGQVTKQQQAPRSFYQTLRKIIFYYCVACMIYVVLHHLAMYFAVTQLTPKPYIETPVPVEGGVKQE